MNYKKLNLYLGWLVFLIATAVYFITIEDTVSLWDCGEYITAAYKLEVGHPPGAPLFMLLGRLFSFFAEPADVAVWINRMSALSSSATILFMFWSITMLAKKMAFSDGRTMTKGSMIAVLGSGVVGSLAYTFTDSFWFSAVEGEVYAMSSLFTAIIFWAMMKWDEEMCAIKHKELDNSYVPMRWMILIMFLFGLAIGVHLLGLLAVPAIAYVIYFNQMKEFNWKGFFLTGILSVFILGFIQEGIIPGTISLASKFEVAFVNSLGMPFYWGSIFFFILLIGGCVFLLRWSKRKGHAMVNAAALGFIVFLIGYGSFATIVIRSNANTPLDENDPENLVTLHAYLKREQYGSWPLLYGPYWNSDYARTEDGKVDVESFGDRSRFYARRFVITKLDQDIKAYKSEKNALAHAKELGPGYEVVEKYFVTNEESRKNQEPVYEQNTIFPRMYWSQDAAKTDLYKSWSGYSDIDQDPLAPKGTDGKRFPTFGENLRYFAHYQVNWMYWRYFMWNFSGRQNDIQGDGDQMRGNWVSGISMIDNSRLGDQSEAPYFTTTNPSNNNFYLLPLIFGLIGMFFHFYRAPKDAFVVLLTFIFTGLAIVIYLNQKPGEPRERDYAYAASFYAFAMWIGLSVYALYEAFTKFKAKENKGIAIVAAGGLLGCLILDIIFDGGMTATKVWILVCLVGAALLYGFQFLGKQLKNEAGGAILAILIVLIAPIIMAVQGWDDHDRSEKTSARDLAYNYLQSCTQNSIIFTNGDNDTFPLWYLQEVEGERTDVRVCNLSLMQTDWYTEQMMMKAYESDPLPIKFREDQILMGAGNTDQVALLSSLDLYSSDLSKAKYLELVELKIKNNKKDFQAAFSNFRAGCSEIAKLTTAKDPSAGARLTAIQGGLASPIVDPKATDVDNLVGLCIEMLSAYSNNLLDIPQEAAQQLQQTLQTWETAWDYLPLKDAMEFVRDDANMVSGQSSKLRAFPCKGFILAVDKQNIVKSGLVTEEELKSVPNEIRFKIDKSSINREQVMMLDVMANNNWKRNLYFSSPGGSDVAMALYQRGYIKQNGMAFELNPYNDGQGEIVVKERMYNNLMKVYSYGKMNKKGVLTDYYTRRHTSQFRDHFSRLADAYLREAFNTELRQQNFEKQLPTLRAQGNNRVADSLQATFVDVAALKKKNSAKAIELIKKSLEVMPPELVLDYGEPQPSREKYEVAQGISYDKYSDGVLHDYVGIFYRAGDKKNAEKLGLKVAGQLETILNYFASSDAAIAARCRRDFIAAMDSYLLLTTMASDEQQGNPNGALAQRTGMYTTKLLKTILPALCEELKNAALDNGESINEGAKEGSLARRYLDFKGHADAVGMEYGFIQKPVQKAPAGGPGGGINMTPEQFQQMMDAQQAPQ